MLLFVNLEVVVLLLSVYYYIVNRKPYQAELIKITEYIKTPKKAGQNQHGSAEWLKPEEFDNVFESFTIDRSNPVIKQLMEMGNKDIERYMEYEKNHNEEKQEFEKIISEIEGFAVGNDYSGTNTAVLMSLISEVRQNFKGDEEIAITVARRCYELIKNILTLKEEEKEIDAVTLELGQHIVQTKKELFPLIVWEEIDRMEKELAEYLDKNISLKEIRHYEEEIYKYFENARAEKAINLSTEDLEKAKKDKEKDFLAIRMELVNEGIPQEILASIGLLFKNAQSLLYNTDVMNVRDINEIVWRLCDEITVILQKYQYTFTLPVRFLRKNSGNVLIKYRYQKETENELNQFREFITAAQNEIPIPPDKQIITNEPILDKGGIVLGMKKPKGEEAVKIAPPKLISSVMKMIKEEQPQEKPTKEKYYYIGDNIHTLCIGATRSGKSRCLVLQSIGASALAGESLFISDPKGELYQYTKPFLERLGYHVVVLDFMNPQKSNKYNLLEPVIKYLKANDVNKAISAIWDITGAIVPSGGHSEKIWENGEASVIASAIMAVVYENQDEGYTQYQNLSNVYNFIAQMAKSPGEKIIPINEFISDLPQGHPAKSLFAIAEIAPYKTRNSFYTSALASLKLFTSTEIYNMTRASDYDPVDLGKEKMAIFVVLPDSKSTYYSIASLLVTQHYMELVESASKQGDSLERRVNFILDEFGNFAKIEDFTNKLTVAGGRSIRFNLFLQSFDQLTEKYNKEIANIIKSNCQNWVYLNAEDTDTLKEMSEKLGQYTTTTYNLSSSTQKFASPSSSQSISLTGRNLLTGEEIGSLKRPDSLVTSRANPAMMYAPDIGCQFWNDVFGLG
ncbi:MAG: type IV secretory system conjugative DNA transfer family protein, partial [Oscillospiraceae bacterium]